MDPSTFESSHVHTVYNAIASDFSRTRHSRWPFVETFLNSLPPGSLVLDAGTGNGKYLGVRSLVEWDGKREERESSSGNSKKGKNKSTESQISPPCKNDLFNVGFDMSDGLLGIASGKGHEVVRGDCVDMTCWRRGSFDHAISIATIHHFATPERRIESIKQMILSILPPSPSKSTSARAAGGMERVGRILIVVWSLEQDPSLLGARSARRTTGGKKGAIEIEIDPLLAQQRKDQGRESVSSIQGGKDGGASGEKRGKDVFVPWEKQEEVVPRRKKEPTPRRRLPKPDKSQTEPSVEEREVEKKSEGEELAKLSIHDSASPSQPSTLEVPSDPSTEVIPSEASNPSPLAPTPVVPKPTFNRYYHLFAHYELSSLVQSAAESLDLDFSCPSDYPLDQHWKEKKEAEEVGEEKRAFVELKEERWERENWVAEIEVGWRTPL